MNVKLNLSYDIKVTLNFHFCRKNVIFFVIIYATLLRTSLYFPKICYQFYCMALYQSQTRRHMIVALKKLTTRSRWLKPVFSQKKTNKIIMVLYMYDTSDVWFKQYFIE